MQVRDGATIIMLFFPQDDDQSYHSHVHPCASMCNINLARLGSILSWDKCWISTRSWLTKRTTTYNNHKTIATSATTWSYNLLQNSGGCHFSIHYQWLFFFFLSGLFYDLARCNKKPTTHCPISERVELVRCGESVLLFRGFEAVSILFKQHGTLMAGI